ncbi:MAG: discoidin domain-containing protein [Methylotetracoccus sp.]
MNLTSKNHWKVSASSGVPQSAIDDQYATAWVSAPSRDAWLQIDLGALVTLGGLEVYWGDRYTEAYKVEYSLDGREWAHLCRTTHGEGGQNVFAFPAVDARHLRWQDTAAGPDHVLEIIEVNLYGPDEAMSVLEPDRLAALGHGPVTVPPGESITVDFGYMRSPLGAMIDWGSTYGTVFSVHLSDDGVTFRDVGRISTGNGDYDSFYWRSTTSRYFRLTVHETNSPEGAIIDELKLRILNKDRMPIGQLERAAAAGPSDLYPQTLLGKQVYWTVIGEIGHAEEALFDEFGNLEPQRGSGQLTPLLRLDGVLRGAPSAPKIDQALAEGCLPAPSVTWSVDRVEVCISAVAADGQALVEYRITNHGQATRELGLVLAVRPAQLNPYWQHGGHAAIQAIAVDNREIWVNGHRYAAVSPEPSAAAVADFDGGDIVALIAGGTPTTVTRLASGSGLLSAAVEFTFTLEPGATTAVVAAAPMRDEVVPNADAPFASVREEVIRTWRGKLGPRKISVGDNEVADTLEAQTALILVNATQHAFKPGPRNYSRTWIRDGSSQALALLYAGLVDEAKTYVLWYAQRIYDNGMVPPILNPDGTVNRGYGSDIEFDAQGEFVVIAADTYRLSRDRSFLEAIYEPVLRATRFIEELCARTNALHGPESRFHGLLAPSISHEGYSKPSYSYWDNFFALRAWRDCAYLAAEIGDSITADYATRKGAEFAADLARSIRMTTESLGTGIIHGSADREDADATSTSIAFEPCRVDDVLPAEYVANTYDHYSGHLREITAPDFSASFTPYEIRNLNAFVALGRYEDAYRMLDAALRWRRPPAFRHWAEAVWGELRAPEYVGDMPHTWIGAEFATAVRRMLLRENGDTLELFRAVPDNWWAGDGIELRDLPTVFGVANLRAQRDGRRVTIDLKLGGPVPQTITVRYPGARYALADGVPCSIRANLISAPNWSRLVIDY